MKKIIEIVIRFAVFLFLFLLPRLIGEDFAYHFYFGVGAMAWFCLTGYVSFFYGKEKYPFRK